MTAHSTATARPHLAELDGFRGLSILAVLAAHMLPLGPQDWRLNTMSAHMGMSIFFCLSGFLIAQFLWLRPDVPVFLARRFGRIVPSILLVSTLFCVVLAWRPESFVAINLYFFNYADYAMLPELTPLWSVALEMQFYVAIALSIWIFGRSGFWVVPLAALAVTGLRIMDGDVTGIRTHERVDEILAGSLLALLWLLRDTRAWARRIAGWIGKSFWPVLGLWALSCWPHTEALNYARPYLSAALVGSILFSSGTWRHGLLSTRWLAYVAAISFALYVWHSPFRFGWWDTGTLLERYGFKRPLAFLLIWAIAHVSTFYYERLFNDWVRRKTTRVAHAA